MDILWAPWRINFIKRPKSKKCFLCEFGKKKNAKFLLWKGFHSIIVMNIYPYNNGHLMVAPILHKKDLEDLTEEEIIEMTQAIKKALRIIKKVLKPEGFNIGVNLGKCSGAGLPGHIHVHIVPRWIGDTNFMPVVASTKVIPQSLEQLSEVLKKEFSES
ncbi:MAG: HIT domain-containing protein [Candidatus Omnitrophica bacterium]|nr:HIT domain-containing protein [Candidatus Omnitrophota bacterium]MCM8816041.1 HIT domain-containing protein [Candidatus Omnitrophota bacterium]